MWSWLRKKLGIVDYSDLLIDLNTKCYEIIKLNSECLHKLELLQLGQMDETLFRTTIKQVNEQMNLINTNIKAIPKEITIKNVLSI